jgi:hypothetical protein
LHNDEYAHLPRTSRYVDLQSLFVGWFRERTVGRRKVPLIPIEGRNNAREKEVSQTGVGRKKAMDNLCSSSVLHVV